MTITMCLQWLCGGGGWGLSRNWTLLGSREIRNISYHLFITVHGIQTLLHLEPQLHDYWCALLLQPITAGCGCRSWGNWSTGVTLYLKVGVLRGRGVWWKISSGVQGWISGRGSGWRSREI